MEKKQKIKNKESWKKQIPLIPGYILVIAWVLFTIMLIVGIFAYSLKGNNTELFKNGIFEYPTGMHFDNFSKVWRASFSTYFANSAFYSLIACVLLILISAPAAYVLSRFNFKFNKLLQTSFVSGMSIPVVLLIMPLFAIAAANGFTNNRYFLAFLLTCANMPFTIFFLMTFFGNLSKTYEEAAAIDGCPPMKTFWKIMLPLAQPGIITVTIFNFITVWNDYFISLIFVGGSEKLKPLAVGVFTIINGMKYNPAYGMPCVFAAVVIIFLPTFILYIFLSEKIIAGVTGGGIKG